MEKESALAKLIETIGKAIGVLYEPTHIRRMAKAKADEIKIIGDAMQKDIFLPTNYDDGKIFINTEDFNGLVERSSKRFVFQEISKQASIDSVINKAAELIDENTFFSSEPVDVGWTNTFFDSITNVSDSNLQQIWAQILASEVIHPGQTSLRTLEIVRRLSYKEVKLFDKLSEYVLFIEDTDNNVFDYFIPHDNSIFKLFDISVVDFIRLEDAGLLANSANIIEEFFLDINSEKEIYAGNDEVVMVLTNNTRNPILIKKNIYLLSEAGREVYSTIYRDKVHTDKNDYYKAVEDYFLGAK